MSVVLGSWFLFSYAHIICDKFDLLDFHGLPSLVKIWLGNHTEEILST